MIGLTSRQISELHEIISRETGGSPALRDGGLLESAIEGIYQTFGGVELYPTLEEKAARLGYALMANHPFVDGNKRIGILAMLVLLEVNGFVLSCTNEDVIAAGLGVASGTLSYEQLLQWVRELATSADRSMPDRDR